MSAPPRGARRRAGSVALGDLLRREASAERAAAGGAERPTVAAGQAGRAKKGEDLALLKPACERRPGAPSTSFSAFAVSAPPPRPLSRSRPISPQCYSACFGF